MMSLIRLLNNILKISSRKLLTIAFSTNTWKYTVVRKINNYWFRISLSLRRNSSCSDNICQGRLITDGEIWKWTGLLNMNMLSGWQIFNNLMDENLLEPRLSTHFLAKIVYTSRGVIRVSFICGFCFHI